MQLKTQSKKIGGNTFAVTQLPAMAGMRMMAKLGRLLPGSAFGDLAAAARQAKGDFANLDMKVVGVALESIFTKVDADELERLITDLLEQSACTMDDKPLAAIFDLAMQGRTVDTLALLQFILSVSFGDFSAAFARLKPDANAVAKG